MFLFLLKLRDRGLPNWEARAQQSHKCAIFGKLGPGHFQKMKRQSKPSKRSSKKHKITHAQPDMLWFRKYFMFGLQCDSPILEAFEYGATRIESSESQTKHFFMDKLFCVQNSEFFPRRKVEGTNEFVAEYRLLLDTVYYKDGQIHRDDRPAFYHSTGKVEWYDRGIRYRKETLLGGSYFYNKKGYLHRENGPARICADGLKVWFRDGHIYRKDGPALEYPNGDSIWVCALVPRMHRLVGPAIELGNGDKIWASRGIVHRKGEPAIVCTSGYKAWYDQGKCYREENANCRKITYHDGEFVAEEGVIVPNANTLLYFNGSRGAIKRGFK
jgi:hypothetical protein